MTAAIQWAMVSRVVTVAGVTIALILIIGGLTITWARTLKRMRNGEKDGNEND